MQVFSSYAVAQAASIRSMIKYGAHGIAIGDQVAELVRSLGGTADVRTMTPEGAAVYLITLMMTYTG